MRCQYVRCGLTPFVSAALFCGLLLDPSPLQAARRSGGSGGKPVWITSQEALRNHLKKVIRQECHLPKHVGVLIRSKLGDTTLFSHRADEKRIPASNIKLLTTAGALAVLGPDYTFPTDVYRSGSLEKGVLNGNLYLKGYGDPLLVQERLRELARALRLRGVRLVKGNIVGDDSFFDKKRYGRGWRDKGSPRPYQAPYGALTLNFSLVTVYVEPGKSVGAPARVQLDPPSDGFRIMNKTVTVSRGRRPIIHIGRRRGKKADIIQVRGNISIHQERRKFNVAVSDPILYSTTAFLAMLKREGIQVEGRVMDGATPADANLLARQLSPPLATIVRGLNKFSNNLVAEQILKTLGAEVHGLPGTTEKGLLVVRDFLLGIGISADDFDLADGSGLSRLNRVTPRAIVALLERMADDFRMRPEFLGSLAVIGVDGTVEKKLRNSDAARRIRAKTGLLFGVHALSGYAAARNGETLVFSILVNENACRPKRLVNRIVLAMTSFNRRVEGPLRAQLENASRMLNLPMPKPSLRDKWRNGKAPRVGPGGKASEFKLGEGVISAEKESDDGSGLESRRKIK